MRTDNLRLYLFYLGIIFTIIGLPFSRAMISFGQVTMAVVFLFDRNLLSKIRLFFRNRAAMSFVLFYVILWLGLLYSKDIDYGLFDLRTKLPLLIFPLVFSTEKPLKPKAFRFFLLLFSATVIASVSTSLWLYFTRDLADFRDAFPFVSHIRLSLEILISISILFYYLIKDNSSLPFWIKALFVIASIFLMGSLFILELMTGVTILIISIIIFFVIYYLRNKSSLWIKAVSIGAATLLLFSALWVYQVSYNYITVKDIDIDKLDKNTKLGNKYLQQPSDYQIENGSYIGIYIQWDEMRDAWNKKSNMDFDGLDKRKQQLKYTLLRYLNSKHLRKDAEGVNTLSATDIVNVEEGIANVEYSIKFSLKKRIYKILWEYGMYQRGETAFGHSLIQRLELWKTAWQIFVDKPIIGVGTGDIPDAFKQRFIDNNSPLANTNLRSHNEYLSVLVTLGIIGFCFFLFSIFYPPTFLNMWSFGLFSWFLFFVCFSMLWEDTIETQVGVTIFAFFYSFYIFADSKNAKKKIK